MENEKQYQAVNLEGGDGFNPYRKYNEPIEEDLDDRAYRLQGRLNSMSYTDILRPQYQSEYDAVMAQIKAGGK